MLPRRKTRMSLAALREMNVSGPKTEQVHVEADFIGTVCLLNSAGMELLISAEDFERVSQYTWTITNWDGRPYAVRESEGKVVPLHRKILDAPASALVDHRNRNGLDNRRINLRLCTPTQNNANQGLRRDSRSGLKGAYWHGGKSKPWRAAVTSQGRRKYIGTYATAEEAHAAYRLAAVEAFGEFACFG